MYFRQNVGWYVHLSARRKWCSCKKTRGKTNHNCLYCTHPELYYPVLKIYNAPHTVSVCTVHVYRIKAQNTYISPNIDFYSQRQGNKAYSLLKFYFVLAWLILRFFSDYSFHYKHLIKLSLYPCLSTSLSFALRAVAASQRVPKGFLKASAELLRVREKERESESISMFSLPLAPTPTSFILPSASVYPLNYQPS